MLSLNALPLPSDSVRSLAADVTSTPCAPTLNVVRDNRYCFLPAPPPSPPAPGSCAKCPASHAYPYGGPVSGSWCCTVPLVPGKGCVSKKICCLTPGSQKNSSYGDDGCEGIRRCGTNPTNKTACVAPPPPPASLVFTDYTSIANAEWKNVFENNTEFHSGCVPSPKLDNGFSPSAHHALPATQKSSIMRMSKILNYDDWPFGNSTPTDFKLWDWSKLTDVITPYSPKARPGVASLAAQHKVKLITDWDTLLLTNQFMLEHNVSQWAAWIEREVEMMLAFGMKGINIDIEHMATTCRGRSASCRELLSNFTCMLSVALHSRAPLAELSSALSLDPKDEVAGYDYTTMASCLDYILIMAYSTAGPTTPGSTLQLRWVNQSVAQYASMGVGANKLVPLLPWFGHNWPCKNATNVTTGEENAWHGIPVCIPLPIPPGPYRNRSAHPPHDVPGYHWEIGYGEALDLLDQFGPTFGPVWDQSTGSNVFEYIDRRTGTRHQVWYESPQSLQVKYGAYAKVGVLGVGMWIGSDFHRGNPAKSKAAAAAMWAAVPGRLKADDGEIFAYENVAKNGRGTVITGGLHGVTQNGDGSAAVHVVFDDAATGGVSEETPLAWERKD